MTKQSKRQGSAHKEVRVWGIRRAEVDVSQLALAYYLLARRRVEQRRHDEAEAGRSTASAVDEEGSEAA